MKNIAPDIEFEVCAMLENSDDIYDFPPEVVRTIDQNDPKSFARAVEYINTKPKETLVIVQHEYGIYGAEDGKNIVAFLKKLQCPVITTLHTVVVKPSIARKRIIKNIAIHSDAVVVLTDGSLKILKNLYPEHISKFSRILHGIHPLLNMSPQVGKMAFGLHKKTILTTFGLMSRNKGLEFVIRALPALKKQTPNIMYLVIGGTHPSVIRTEGESYRHELETLVDELFLRENVTFIPEYLPLGSVLQYLQATDIYIATSLDPNQAVSGTLSYALGAGRAVVSTMFAQALEVITPDVGRIVPMRNSAAMAKSLGELLEKPEQLDTMSTAAYQKTRSMLWANVAHDYVLLAVEISHQNNQQFDYIPKISWEHLKKLSDGKGFLQFADKSMPLVDSGYTLDDNSRALQIALQAHHMSLMGQDLFRTLTTQYLSVLNKCLSHNPAVNYIDARTGRPTPQNQAEDLTDSMARSYYALCTAMSSVDDLVVRRALALVPLVPMHALENASFVHSLTQLLLAANQLFEPHETSSMTMITRIADKLITLYDKNKHDSWLWFADILTYANGQTCTALLEAAKLLGRSDYSKVGLKSLDFLRSVCFMGDVYVPIGQNGWYPKDGYRALYDQQPEDVFSMMQALEVAYNITKEMKYKNMAIKAFSWFLGNNLSCIRVYNDKTGGCRDGLEPHGVNLNEGAESTLSYLGSRLIIYRLLGC